MADLPVLETKEVTKQVALAAQVLVDPPITMIEMCNNGNANGRKPIRQQIGHVRKRPVMQGLQQN